MTSKTDAKKRITRMLSLMDEKGLDLIIAYSNALKPDNVFYLTGYNLVAGEAWAELDKKGEVKLWLSEEWDLQRALASSWADSTALIVSLQQENINRWQQGENVALAGKELVPARYETVMKTFLDNVASGSKFLGEAALVKSPEEIELLRRAARAADRGFMRACRKAKPGIKEYELLAEIEYIMRLDGATDNFQLMSSGTHSLGMVVGRNKEILPGELLLFEITPAFGSITYSAQLCRTIYMGKPEQQLLDKYGILVEAMQAALDIIRPGIPWNEVYNIQNKVFSDAGYKEYCGPPYMRTRGHGFGLTQSFNIDEQNGVLMEPGMILVVHPNQYLPETGYLALGEMVLVTETGCEKLSEIPMELFIS